MELAGIEFSERELVGRVMKQMSRPMKGSRYAQRWVVVKHTFGVGSGVAFALCREFGLDPEDELR